MPSQTYSDVRAKLLNETAYTRAPRILKGAFVQLLEDIVGFVPNIVSFQYNPTTISRSLSPWNPFAVDQAQRGSQAPSVQPFDVPESFSSFQLFLDAVDGMEQGSPIAETMGIEPQLAALRKLTQASAGLLGDLTASAKDLAGRSGDSAQRPTVAPTLLVLGKRVILPVRITSFTVEETFFGPSLYPIRATVSLDMEVMTPDAFRCHDSPTAKVAIGAYEFTRLQEDAAAVLNVANLPDALRSVIPI